MVAILYNCYNYIYFSSMYPKIKYYSWPYDNKITSYCTAYKVVNFVV